MIGTSNILTPLHRSFLGAFAASERQKEFFLTGGTALAHFYLQHRLSEDLDFFTEIPGAVSRVRPTLDALAADLALAMDMHREHENFLEVFLTRGNETVRCDFALASPFRLPPTILAEEFGIYIESQS